MASFDLDALRALGDESFPGHVGVVVDEVDDTGVRSRLELRDHLLAPNGYIHAGVVVTLADTTCGYGCLLSLPEGATGFTTIELKTNFLATVRRGVLGCEAQRVHGGRTTQVWDATVRDEDGRVLALFRCTQLVLYPRG